jgi:hypothetical protein
MKAVLAILAAGAGLVALSRSLVFGSARAAQAYVDLRSDPLDPIISFFNKLVKTIGRPVVVFVDDLDRCQSKYVVEFLEGIQTLFRTTPITYVVAADRKWICSSFEKEYEVFGKTVGEAARPVGYLFLDKILQVSASVPCLAPEVKRDFWKALLRAGAQNESESQDVTKAAEIEALNQVKARNADTQDALEKMIEEATKSRDPLKEQAMRAAAAKHITSPKAQHQTEHRLQRFASLLEPNPRAMKRLVNAYGLHQATHFLESRKVSQEALVLWTIMELRWPLLSDFLAAHPEHCAGLRAGTVEDGIPDDLKALYRDDEVKAVLNWNRAALDENSIREIIGSVKPIWRMSPPIGSVFERF